MDDVPIAEDKQEEWQESLAKQKERRMTFLKEEQERCEREKKDIEWRRIFW